MQAKFTFAALIFLQIINILPAQTVKDVTVPVTATVSSAPAGITLTWPNPSASNLLIQRRTKGQSGFQWIQLLSAANSTQSTLTDTNVVSGLTYEYHLRRSSNVNAYGYVQVAVEAPATENRGKVLLFVDADIAAPLAPELERLREDLTGDGWQIIEHITDTSATVQSVKNQIVADFNADPAQVRSVFLLGKIPIPYSGNYAWDGHPEHAGAWPADVYYADVNNSLWSDASVNNTSPARAANHNVPGDGKFDQNTLPSPVELQLGRVDFRRLTQGTFGATTVELLRRYLDKNHRWRTGAYTVENKALVDDNFMYFNGEAFAANGYRNAYPLVGEANVIAADFFNDSNPQSYLMGYGCGSGGYSSAGGVGNSTNFATDSVNIVFSNLFGSYHGDWDFETNPFMPSALASRGGILTCSWAGRPHHFYQALASGETIGYCMKETHNAVYNSGYFPSLSGEGGIQTALLGDPTLRAHIVAPPANATAISGCGKVLIEWSPSADTAVVGYHIYASKNKHGEYTRLNSDPVAGTSFFDEAPVEDTLYYQVRAVKRQTSPGGGIYRNTSTGAMASVIYAPASPPAVSIDNTGDIITCLNQEVELAAVSAPAGVSFQWSGPNNFSADDQNVVVTAGGNYMVSVTLANGCTNTATTTVLQNTTPPLFTTDVSGILTCTDTSVTISITLSPNICSCFITGPGGFFSTSHIAEVTVPGVYTLQIESCLNGCTATETVFVLQDVAIPSVPALQDVTITCATPAISLPGGFPGISYHWEGPCITTPPPLIACPGDYTLTATNDANGCTSTATMTVTEDTAPPGASIVSDGGGLLTCQMPKIQLTGESPTPGVTFEWTGPGGFTSFFAVVEVTLHGTYTLTVTGPGNGCTSTASITIETDGSQPNVYAEGGTLTCTDPELQLNGGSNTPGATFFWTGPGGFTSTEEDPIVSEAGIYLLTVTAPNGCSAQAAAIVNNATSIPIEIDATFSDASSPGANDGSIDLSVFGGVPPYEYAWSNGATTQDIGNIPAGIYTVTVTDAAGCTTVLGIEVGVVSNTNEAAVFQHLSLSPNPATGPSSLFIKLFQTAAVRLAVRDANGRPVLENPETKGDELILPVDLSDYPPGIYTVFIFVDNEVFVRKMAVVR